MYNLTIGLGGSVFNKVLKPFDSSDLFGKIKQHRIILSPALIDYYVSCVPEVYQDDLLAFFDGISNNDEQSMSCKDNHDLDARENLICFVDSAPKRVLISETSEFDGYNLGKLRITTPNSIVEEIDNVFNRYTIPLVNYVAPIGMDCEFFSRWFGDLFNNEERIQIIDKYCLGSNGIASFKKYYLPKIKPTTRVEFYYVFDSKEYSSEEYLRDLIEKEFDGWDIHVFLCKSDGFHDRYIILKSQLISLGGGIEFLHPCGRITKNCTINISKKKKTSDLLFPVVRKVL